MAKATLSPYFITLSSHDLKLYPTPTLLEYAPIIDALYSMDEGYVLALPKAEFDVYINTAARLWKYVHYHNLMDGDVLEKHVSYFDSILWRNSHGDFDWASWTFEEIMRDL
jgi:hypothetical protein